MSLPTEALTTWFNDVTIKRGYQYAKQERVERLWWHPKGMLLGVVRGTERYTVALGTQRITRAEVALWGLECECNCPVHRRCKHAVALLVAFQRRDSLGLVSKPLLESNLLLSEVPTAQRALREMLAEQPTAAEKKTSEAKPKVSIGSGERLKLLGQQPAAALAKALNTLCDEVQGVESRAFKLLGLRWRASGEVLSRLSQNARDALLRLGQNMPPYRALPSLGSASVVQHCAAALRALQDQGGSEDVLHLWDEAFDLVQASAEASDEDRPAKEQFAACIQTVGEALMVSDLEITERMLWLFGLESRDHAELLGDLSDRFWNQDLSAAHWRGFAEALAHMPESASLLEARIDALHNAGAAEEALRLRRASLDSTRAHVHLIQLYGEMSRPKDAFAAATYALSQRANPKQDADAHIDAITQALLGVLSSAADSPLLAGWCWKVFLMHPSVPASRRLQSAAERAHAWEPIKAWMFSFLSTGLLPSAPDAPPPEAPKKRGRKPKKAPPPVSLSAQPYLPSWPEHVPFTTARVTPPPPARLLFEIALECRDPHWISQSVPRLEAQETPTADILERAAAALLKTHRAEAAELLRRVIDAHIARGTYSHQLQPPLRALHKVLGPKPWIDYIRSLKTAHARRPSLIEALNNAIVQVRRS